MQGETAHITPPEARRVVVAIGSNQGDREAHLRYAITSLQVFLHDSVVSAFIKSRPQGASLPSAPLFLNAVVVGGSFDSPWALLDRLHRIEHERGRIRSAPGAPRTLDLDLILVGNLEVDSATLTVPHPRFREREFVLGPLAAIAPDLVDPVSKRTIRDLLAQLSGQ